ncbi:unnamed protein product [Sphenostylis stenocarpa]|uniref:Prolamin-like domain-containing protein n=1 Tax=Sphenostylis stenocarpa TaxID=92480 RepID=A0AA86TBH2_9FABA|nr:unnamed protein product [Sphenostylis stenocarpa]
MAASMKLCLIMMFMAIATSSVKPCLSYEVFDPFEGPISPMTSFEKLLTDCILKLHPPCDNLYMFGTIFFYNETISKDCCSNIREMGKQCHDTLTTYILNLPKSKAKKTLILQRSKQVWKECNHPLPRQVQNVASDANSIDCSSKFHSQCGEELYFGIFFGNDTVSRDCCQNLVVDVGKECKDIMTKLVLRFPRFKQNETLVLRRSDQIWNDCLSFLVQD